jgi:polyhydroxyalkanoic acid synthase PhaR subunit
MLQENMFWRSEKMSDENNKHEKQEFEPFAQMIQFYDAMSKTWSKAMSEAVASESFAKSMGEQLEGSLDTLSLIQNQMGAITEKYLEQMNLPTRKDLISLGERLTRIEMVIDDLDSKLDEVLETVKRKKS